MDDQQKIAVDIMKSYQGVDAQGLRLFDAVMIQIENAYPTEKILEHKDTVLEISVVNMESMKEYGFYEVYSTFKTYNDSRQYVWLVNIMSGEISSLNDGARKMINIVDNYD